MESSTSAPFDLGAMVTSTPGVYGGRPCLAGTRYPILEIAVNFTAGDTPEEIAADYGLSLPHVYAGIAYYLSNREAIDADLEESRREYREGYAEYLAVQRRALG